MLSTIDMRERERERDYYTFHILKIIQDKAIDMVTDAPTPATYIVENNNWSKRNMWFISN